MIFKKILMSMLLIFFIFALFFKAQIATFGTLTGLKFCVEILIPSIFPFMILSNFMIFSNFSQIIPTLFGGIINFLFFLPKETASAIFFGMFGGYPIGPKISKEIFEKKIITQQQLENLLAFCVNAGPSFSISIVGICLLKNIKIGVVIFISQILTSIIIGIILGLISRKSSTNKKNSNNIKQKNTYCPMSDALVKACEHTSTIMINICTIIVCFNIIISFINYYELPLKIVNFISIFKNDLNIKLCKNIITFFLIGFLEVVSGCDFASKTSLSPVLIMFLLSWGGICVHAQIKSIFNEVTFSYYNFIKFRVINAIISSLLVLLILKFLKLKSNTELQTFNFDYLTVYPKEFEKTNLNLSNQISSNIFGSTALIFSCIYFLINL